MNALPLLVLLQAGEGEGSPFTMLVPMALIFMIFYYRFAGFVACFALLMTLLLVLAVEARAEAYLGLNAGAYLYDQELDGLGLEDLELRDATVGAHAGYIFTEWFGVEAWYQTYVEGEETLGGEIRIRGEGDAYGFSLRPALRVSHDFELFAKLGLAFWDAKAKFDVPSVDLREAEKTDGEDFTWGFGGRWWGGEHWSVGAEFSRIEAEKDVQFDVVNMSAAFHF